MAIIDAIRVRSGGRAKYNNEFQSAGESKKAKEGPQNIRWNEENSNLQHCGERGIQFSCGERGIQFSCGERGIQLSEVYS